MNLRQINTNHRSLLTLTLVVGKKELKKELFVASLNYCKEPI